MPISEPAKVSISPKAMSTLWCISANGGQMKPAISSRTPKVHSTIANIRCKRCIMVFILSPLARAPRNLINPIFLFLRYSVIYCYRFRARHSFRPEACALNLIECCCFRMIHLIKRSGGNRFRRTLGEQSALNEIL